MLPSLSQGPEKPSVLSALKKALTQQDPPSMSLKGLYNLVLGSKPGDSPQEPHLIGQRPVLNQFQDPLSASLNRMRLILPISDAGGGTVAREAPSQPTKPLVSNATTLELPRPEKRVEEHQQRVQEFQLAQLPLESQRRGHREKDDIVLDSTGRPLMRRGHADSWIERIVRGITASLALSFSLLKALLAIPLLLIPLRIRLRIPLARPPQTPRMRAPR